MKPFWGTLPATLTVTMPIWQTEAHNNLKKFLYTSATGLARTEFFVWPNTNHIHRNFSILSSDHRYKTLKMALHQ